MSPVSDDHVIDGGVLGQGEDIAGFEPGIARIDEALFHDHPRHRAADPDIDLGAEQRGGDVLTGKPGGVDQRAAMDVVEGHGARCGGDGHWLRRRVTRSVLP